MSFKLCDGNMVPSRCDFRKDDLIDNFLVMKELGEGAFGKVFQVKDSSNGQIKALKLLKLWEVPYAKEREKVVQRFQREFECGQISSPYLVRSLDYGCYQGNPYLVMEFCPNGSLCKYVSDLPAIRPTVNEIARDILLGLKDLHKNGIFHRDIKPENILFDKNNKVKLTDFGIAGFKQQRLTITNIFGKARDIFGTYAYIAPEQADNRTAFRSMNAVTDIFSYGVTMYELLSGGHYPFGTLDSHSDLANYMERARKGDWEDIRFYNPTLPAYWIRTIEGCLNPDYVNGRFQTVREVSSSLDYHIQPSINDLPQNGDFILKITYGEENGKEYNLSRMLAEPTGILKLGWLDESLPHKNDIEVKEISSAFISNFHATLEKVSNPERWFIKDGQWRQKDGQWGWYHSKNGVVINSQNVGSDFRVGKEIKANDILIIGDTTLKVMVK